MTGAQRLNLSHVRRCSERWDDMPAAGSGSGRTCRSCAVHLHDFRGLSDLAIARLHAKGEGRVCGIYDDWRLRGEPGAPPSRLRRWAGVASVGLSTAGAFAGATADEAMAHPLPVVAAQRTSSPAARASIAATPAVPSDTTAPQITGHVFDETGEPLIGASVFWRGTDVGTVTDLDGAYALDLLGKPSADTSAALVITYIGYARKVIESVDPVVAREIDIRLLVDDLVEMVYFGVSRAPWHVRIWRKATSPFRAAWRWASE